MSRLRLKRLVGYGLGLAGALLLLCVGALSLLLYHPDAPRWVLERLPEHTGVKLTVDHHQGVLAGPLSLSGVRLQGDFGQLEIEQIELHWRPGALWRAELHIASLQVSRSRLSLPPASPQEPERAEPDFAAVALPLGLRIDRLLLEELAIAQPQQPTRRVERLHLRAWSESKHLHIEQFDLTTPELALQASGRLGLASTGRAALALAWRYQSPQWPLLEGQGEVTGDLDHLRVRQTVSGPLNARLQASVKDLTKALSWEASARLQPSELSDGLGDWLADHPLQVGGELHSRGDLERIEVEADLDLVSGEFGEAALRLKGNLDLTDGRFTAERLRLEIPAGGFLEAGGLYQHDEKAGRFETQLSWRDLRWPLQGDAPEVMSKQGRLSLRGTPSAYDYQLSGLLQMPGQPIADIDAAGSGDLEGLRLERWLVKLDPGRLQGQGELRWQPEPQWQFTVEGEQIDPSLWAQALPGRLTLAAESSGRLSEQGLEGQLQLNRLQGQVREYPVQAGGQAVFAGDSLKLDKLQLNSGNNRLDVSGEIGEELALAWRIQAPELAGVWPGMGGDLAGSGRLEGSLQAPRLKAQLAGTMFSFGELQAKRQKLEADLSLAGKQPLVLRLTTGELRTPAGSWRELDLALAGSLPAHRLSLALQGGEAPQLALDLAAGWVASESVWQGRLEALSLRPLKQDKWALAEASAFSLGAQRQGLERLCLQAGEAELCGHFDRTPSGSWQAAMEARAFPFNSLQPWLPQGWHMDGLGQGEVNLSRQPDGGLLGDWQVRLSEAGGELVFSEQPQPLRISGAVLKGKIDKEAARTRLEIKLGDQGKMTAEIKLPAYNPFDLDPAKQRLMGRVRFGLQDLSRFARLSPSLLNPQGDVRGDFTLDGTLAQPRLLGRADLTAGGLDIPELGLELREINLSLSAPSLERLALQGNLRSGKGRLELQGGMMLDAEADFPARLTLEGEKFTLSNLPEAEVRVTPELQLERDSEGTRVQGRIEIPYARLRPRKLPKTAVRASPDLVIVGEDREEQRPFDPRLSANLQLVMGDRVSFDGFGLRGKLTGRLILIDEPERPVIGRGRIGIKEGTYKAYGQDLRIERGYALFADSPVENPGLDVRAVRDLDQVTAGVQVSGTLKRPKIDLFSTPAMSEGDVLSYLLTGRAQGEGGGESLGVAAAIRASGAGMMAEEIGRQFGLDELRLDAGSGLEDASVVAGTYLSPRLYIQYINELASRQTKVRLRYDINRRLQLEAETGKTQAGDLYYTFDR
jgi:translocation and assembly module TamB